MQEYMYVLFKLLSQVGQQAIAMTNSDALVPAGILKVPQSLYIYTYIVYTPHSIG